uniref:uncharacterized protein LOC124038687 n=2 Tax=Oncorhynchus TaxID=8016 RepID=UPI001EAEC692|nr:uncharacterized protein LOC124038687 [Oncorhynchus gorbuscha]
MLAPHFSKGHTLYVDNCYSSPTLFQNLLSNSTGACGTVRSNRKGMPAFGCRKMQRGEAEFKENGQQLAIKWHDKRDVHVLSTVHIAIMSATGNVDHLTGERKIKPDYLKMGAVDKADMINSFMECTQEMTKCTPPLGAPTSHMGEPAETWVLGKPVGAWKPNEPAGVRRSNRGKETSRASQGVKARRAGLGTSDSIGGGIHPDVTNKTKNKQKNLLDQLGEQELTIQLMPNAAFDTVNHQILLSTLSELGISGAAHAWIASYLTCRSYQVANRISACLADISVWMTDHHLKLNLGKTELLFLPGKDCPFHDLAITVDNSIVSSSQSAKNLGVILDNTLSFSTNIKAVARSCRFMLYNIRRVRPCLTQEAAQVLIQALVISRLDYCNSLLAGLPACAIKPLQLIQNAAARLVFNLPKFSHVTPLLRSLHWLPVEARIRYKTMVLAYGAVRGTAPQYLQALIRPYTQTRALRSSTSGLLASLPLRKYSSRSAQSKLFAALAPQWWNKLPHDARTAESITTFRRHLKPHLFKEYLG